MNEGDVLLEISAKWVATIKALQSNPAWKGRYIAVRGNFSEQDVTYVTEHEDSLIPDWAQVYVDYNTADELWRDVVINLATPRTYVLMNDCAYYLSPYQVLLIN